MWVKKICECPGDCECNYHFGFKHKRKRYRKSSNTANHKLACRIAQKFYNDTVGGKAGVGPATPITALLSELVETFDDWYKAEHPRSYARIGYVLPSFQVIFTEPTDPKIVDIEPFDLQRWRTARLEEHERSTVQREYNIIRTMFREAETWWPGFVSPGRKVKGWKIDDAEMRILTPTEIHDALTLLPPVYAAICRVTLETLARISEVLGITRKDIGVSLTKDGPIYWLTRRLKGGKRKRVRISEGTYQALLAQLTRKGQDRLFEYENSKGVWAPMQQECTSSYFTRLFRDLKLDGISHHSFRHTGITMMLDDGINPRVIQELAGWKSLRMLERYGHVRDVEMERAVTGNAAKVADYVAKRPDEATSTLGEATHE